jgi:hypothetical protein
MKKTSIEEMRAEVVRLTREIAELKMQQQQAKLDDGLPISEDEKAEFARTKEQWELDQVAKMQQLAEDHPDMKPKTLRADWGHVQNHPQEPKNGGAQ